MKRPMRPYKLDLMFCTTCGRELRPDKMGTWTHVRRLTLREWHKAVPT